jgi:hypothetical protein
MPPYALQWRAIRDAKEAGCSRYDLYGISALGRSRAPDARPLSFQDGVRRGGRQAAGSVDVPVSRAAYACYRAAEMARALWYKRAKKLAAAIRRGFDGSHEPDPDPFHLGAKVVPEALEAGDVRAHVGEDDELLGGDAGD